ncbi:hypothetical protein MKW92_010110 [Papaver armeniacum]|nr:hypothetical protein MKW92_010110 [Papaver armeniacum]
MDPKNKKPKISPQLYLSSDHQKTHAKYYSKKKVISERYIDYKCFPKYPISKCFAGNNMITSLLHIHGPAPISPVLLFYSQIHNLSEEDQSFDTYIEGKIHKITPNVIASLLRLDRPSKPVSFPPLNEDKMVVSKDEFRNAVYRPEHVDSNDPNYEIKVGHLKPIIGVLVKICQSNILPQFKHHYTTNLISVYLSFLLLNGYPVDISYAIWHTMARVAPSSCRTNAVPYGIIVGRLLSYLGHPFPAHTPCTRVPSTFDLYFLSRNHFPYDPQDSNDTTLSQLHSDGISPPLPPPSAADYDASELPLSLPNDPPSEFVRLSESVESLKDTMEVILSRFEQQHEEFMLQKKKIEHIAHQQDHLQQQHEEFGQQQKLIDHISSRQNGFEQQYQEMSDRIARQEDRLKQQLEKFAQLRKITDCITTQQDRFELRIEEFKKQREMIDRLVTWQDRFEQQNQKMISGVVRKHDSLVRRQHHYQAMLMQYVQRAYPGQVNSICRECGDSGYAELLIYCNLCHTSAEHSYCLDKITKNGEDATWTCEECEQTAGFGSQQIVQVTSSKEVIEVRL